MPTFSLTSCNTRWGLDVDDRPFDLAGALARFDTDLVALQEVWEPHDGSGVVRPAAAALGYEVLHVALSGSTITPRPEITAEPEEVDGTWGTVLLTRLPVTSVRTIDLGRLVERWDIAARHALVAELDVGGTAVAVAGIHLSFALPNAAAQLRRLTGALPADRPSVIVGDCNLWGPTASALTRGRRRAVRGRTWPVRRPAFQLDHILVSPDIDVLDGRVLPTIGSDHLPISATLRVPPTG